MWSDTVAMRLRRLRKDHGLGQEHVASALAVSVSEVSRLERGVRGLRVEQLDAWARALDRNAEVVLWIRSPTAPRPAAEHLSPEHLEVLEIVATALTKMPPTAREALRQQMLVWITAMGAQADQPTRPGGGSG